jgi:DTW domain-containing protein YfiP
MMPRRPPPRTLRSAPHPRVAALRALPVCARCLQPEIICVCRDMAPIAHRLGILILQHPQEQDHLLGTARLTAIAFPDAGLKIGLSWRSLAHALGRPAEPRRWAVLYLGSEKAETLAKGRELVLLDGKGAMLADQKAALAGTEGIVLLDGSWSQAKALWWRNAWMLKCRRLVLGPKHASRFGKLRREPRRDALSTLEAAALAVARLEGKPEIEETLGACFQTMLDRYGAALKVG